MPQQQLMKKIYRSFPWIPKKYLSEAQVAEQIGLSVSWLRKNRQRFEEGITIPFIKIGQCVRYDPEVIEQYLQSKTNKGLPKSSQLI